jgi:hypothetical protein
MKPKPPVERYEKAYRAAEYRIMPGNAAFTLRVDQADPQADRQLRDLCGVQHNWAILTPCNPRSEIAREELNLLYHNEMRELLEAGTARWLPALNHDPSGHWPDEPGFLLCDPPPGLAEQLARQFHQNAIVAARLGEAPQLVWL